MVCDNGKIKRCILLRCAQTGIIEITWYITDTGKIFIDNVDNGKISKGETIQFFKCSIGEHQVKLNSKNEAFTETVKVSKGNIAKLTILPRPNETKTALSSDPSVPKGDLQLFYNGFEGKVFVDGDLLGNLKKDENILIKNLSVGEHLLVIRGNDKALEKSILIADGKITFEPPIDEKPPIKKDVSSGFRKFKGFEGFKRW